MSESATAPTDTPRPAAARGYARAAWADRLTRFAQSGLRPAQFCAQEGVSLPSFYAWKRRLAANASGATPAANAGAPRAPRWLPVRLHDAPAPVELALPGGAVVRIAPGADEATLRCLLRLLGVPAC